MWPEYITIMLWLFALLVAADRLNNLQTDLNRKTPEMKFSEAFELITRLTNFHTLAVLATYWTLGYNLQEVPDHPSGTHVHALAFMLDTLLIM